MSEESNGGYGREVRDTIVKSSLTGVGLTVLAVTVFSPAGLGGMIGTSLASALGNDRATTASDDPYANLPPYPAPLTQSEITDIRGQLAATAASLEITRAATEDKIEYVHELAQHPGALAIPPAGHFAKSAPAAHVQSAAPTPAQESAPAAVEPEQAAATPIGPVSYSSADPALRDSHLEFAALLLGVE